MAVSPTRSGWCNGMTRPLTRPASRQGDDWVSPGWGFSWPANRRILYNRAAADPDGDPWPKEERLARRHLLPDRREARGYVYWDDTQTPPRWVGLDVPDFPAA